MVDASRQRKAEFPSTRGHPFTLNGSTGQEKHAHGMQWVTPKGLCAKPFHPAWALGLFGVHHSLNIYIYIYMHVWIYIHKYLCIALTKEKVKASWRNESGAEARSSTRMPRLPLSLTPTVPPPMAGPYKSLAQATQKQRSCFHFKRNLLFPNWTNRAA